MSEQTFELMLQQAAPKLKQVAPDFLDVNRLMRLALAMRSRNPLVGKASKESVLLFLMKCAETGLEPIGAGGAHAVPFRNNKTDEIELTFIPDWRGLISLAKRSGQIKHAYAKIVYENDAIDYAEGDDPHLTHKPNLQDPGKPIGAYLVVVLPDDSKHIEYMREAEIVGIKNRSKAKESGPWVTDELEMWKKTVVRRGLKPFTASPEMHAAIDADNAALGLVDLEPRIPVSMPKAIGEPAEPKKEETPKKPASDDDQLPLDQSEETPKSANLIVGKVLEVKELKSGGTGKKKWTLYGIKIEGVDGDMSLSTFDAKLAGEADALRGEETPVKATWKPSDDGKYKNLMTLEPANQPQPAGAE